METKSTCSSTVYGKFEIDITKLRDDIASKIMDEASAWLYEAVEEKFNSKWSKEGIENEIVSRTVDKIITSIEYNYSDSKFLTDKIIDALVCKIEDDDLKNILLQTFIKRIN